MYTIQFDFPGDTSPCYAGIHKGAAGWAPTLATARFWSDKESAQRWLENGYGATGAYGTVIKANPVNKANDVTAH